MGCRGRHLAITPAQFEELLRIAEDKDSDDSDVWEAIQAISERLPATTRTPTRHGVVSTVPSPWTIRPMACSLPRRASIPWIR
jgi:hypothetical protein